MAYKVRELRDMTGMTQKDFAGEFGIPLSTLRKWEQGESSPPAYVIMMLARLIPSTSRSVEKIKDKNGREYYYDSVRKMVYDSKGNGIAVRENPAQVKKENLPVYLSRLFEDFYEIREKFECDCRYDAEEDIIWI